MSDHQTPTDIADDVARESSEDELISFNEMKSILQDAEKRLLGQEPPPVDATIHGARTHSTLIARIPKLHNTVDAEPYLGVNSKMARINLPTSTNSKEQRLANQRPPSAAERRSHTPGPKGSKPNAGPEWFHLPRTKLTSDLKRELQLLKMRSTWDSKRHYKGDNQRSLIPEYSQIGTFMEDPAEYYSSRIRKRDRRTSFLEEVLAAEESSSRFKSTYTSIQSFKSSGRRAFYDKLKGNRRKR
ncbi:MAG: hypothetical protein L6R41_003491 [Letrouitia leprolyta]|nr:MAG: hypothetical protein L6R41_003491 [Letrouitia leprolyta]